MKQKNNRTATATNYHRPGSRGHDPGAGSQRSWKQEKILSSPWSMEGRESSSLGESDEPWPRIIWWMMVVNPLWWWSRRRSIFFDGVMREDKDSTDNEEKEG